MTADSTQLVTLTERDTDENTPPAADAPLALTISDNKDVGIFEGKLDGVTVAGVVYSRTADHVTLLATSVFPEFRGRGIAAAVLTGVLDRLRAEGEKATVTCPFATQYLAAHPEYHDVIDPAGPGAARRTH